jgi:hypothetical protein
VTLQKIMPFRKLTRRRVVFLYRKSEEFSGSTTMRVHQLSEMVANNIPSINVVTQTNPFFCFFSIVILNKSFLKKIKRRELLVLRLFCNVLLADYIDSRINNNHLRYLHGLIASSQKSYNIYREKYEEHVVFHLTHHVDPRIVNFNKAMEFKCGYFGEPVNGFLSSEIKKYVDVIEVNTKSQDISWLKELENYNCHYLVRNTSTESTPKPFLKGFTAARCGAVVLVARGVEDAEYYLGEDYPFFVDEPVSVNKVLDALKRVEAAYGNTEWQAAKSQMKKVASLSSTEQVLNEFRAILRYFFENSNLEQNNDRREF